MSNLTDTNQASEELKQKLLDTKTFSYNVYFGVGGGDYAISFDEALDEIVSIIRTEKLKLLAEVRERVIGEDDKQTKNDEGFGDWLVCTTCNVILSDETASEYLCICTLRNDLRVEQRDNLTKLEAEL